MSSVFLVQDISSVIHRPNNLIEFNLSIEELFSPSLVVKLLLLHEKIIKFDL